MKSNLSVLSAVVLLSLGLAGAAIAKETVLPTVGPESDQYHGPMVGYLRVFTSTNQVETGDSTWEYPHSDYKVCGPTGKVVAFVPNSVGDVSGAPATVELPPGKYIVHAASDKNGFVAVPVIIKGGHTTVVDLESRHIGGYRDASGPVIAWSGGSNSSTPYSSLSSTDASLSSTN